MVILGLNAFHADSSAALVRDGVLVAAAEEERFRRIKHWAGFPSDSIAYCLREARLRLEDLDHVAVNQNNLANILRKVGFLLANRPEIGLVLKRIRNRRSREGLSALIAEALPGRSFRGAVHNIEHHLAHLSSAFHVSPFNEAVVVSIDGFGDFSSAAWGVGRGRDLFADRRVHFPHSLGIFYQALTQYLGFPHYGDEYKVMGLAPYGQPLQLEAMRDIVRVQSDGTFRLNLDYFTHHSAGLDMVWQGGMPVIGPVFSQYLVDRLGPMRAPEETIEQKHKDLAASMQAMFEEAFFALANALHEKTKNPRFCLAGGCAYNSVANGLVFDRSPYKDLYIQAAAGDAGGAIGAAYWVWNEILGNTKSFVMTHAYWGPEYDDVAIDESIDAR
ncbi:MAG: carbamoyltransferase N-terminal domain-containing protein, partial [bacterium]